MMQHDNLQLKTRIMSPSPERFRTWQLTLWCLIKFFYIGWAFKMFYRELTRPNLLDDCSSHQAQLVADAIGDRPQPPVKQKNELSVMGTQMLAHFRNLAASDPHAFYAVPLVVSSELKAARTAREALSTSTTVSACLPLMRGPNSIEDTPSRCLTALTCGATWVDCAHGFWLAVCYFF